MHNVSTVQMQGYRAYADCESACNRLPLLLPTNMLGMARSIIGRNALMTKFEKLTRKYVLLR